MCVYVCAICIVHKMCAWRKQQNKERKKKQQAKAARQKEKEMISEMCAEQMKGFNAFSVY